MCAIRVDVQHRKVVFNVEKAHWPKFSLFASLTLKISNGEKNGVRDKCQKKENILIRCEVNMWHRFCFSLVLFRLSLYIRTQWESDLIIAVPLCVSLTPYAHTESKETMIIRYLYVRWTKHWCRHSNISGGSIIIECVAGRFKSIIP